MFRTKTLDNGLKIIVDSMPEMSSAAIGIWIGVGGRYEDERLAGIAHFIEHMVFKGTGSRTCQQIKEEIEGVGGYLNAFTSKEHTCYYSKLLGTEYKHALNVLSDLVINPIFDQKDIDQERGVILEEIKMYLDLPMHYVHDLLDTVLWPGHPMGLYLTGTNETVNSFSRDDFVKFKEAFYVPNNIVVSCAGDVDYEEVCSDIEEIFSVTKNKDINKFEQVQQVQKVQKVKLLNKQTEQTHIAMGINAYSRHHQDRYALGILNIILGGNMSSRLFKEIREERGLAYEIKTSLSRYDDTGVFEISAGTEHKNSVNAIEVIIKELDKIKQKKVSDDEFKRAKKYYIGNFLMSLEKTAEKMLWLGEGYLNEKEKSAMKTPGQVVDAIEAVTIDDILRVSNDVFQNDKMHMAIIGSHVCEEDVSKVFCL